MDEKRITGTAKELRGRIQSAVGNATGYEPDRVEGRRRQAVGRAEDLYGRTEDATRGGMRAARRRVGESPLLGLLAAGAVGYALALLVRGRR